MQQLVQHSKGGASPSLEDNSDILPSPAVKGRPAGTFQKLPHPFLALTGQPHFSGDSSQVAP